MAWTPQKTWSSEVLTSSDLNVYLRDDMEYLKGVVDGVGFSAVHVSRAATQSIPDGADTDVVFDTENLDFGGWWTSGATITVPAGAVPSGFTTIAVHLIPKLNFATDATGNRRLLILVNGAEIERMTLSALTGDPTVVQHSTYAEVAAGDTIKLQAYQNSGGNLNLQAGGIWVVRHAPAS